MRINSELKDLDEHLSQVIRKAEVACLNLQIKCEKIENTKVKNVFESIGNSFQKNICHNLNSIVDKLECIRNYNSVKDMHKEEILKEVKKIKSSAHMLVFNLKIEQARYFSNLESEIGQISTIIREIDEFYVKLRTIFGSEN